jgi:hypothetical protein
MYRSLAYSAENSKLKEWLSHSIDPIKTYPWRPFDTGAKLGLVLNKEVMVISEQSAEENNWSEQEAQEDGLVRSKLLRR